MSKTRRIGARSARGVGGLKLDLYQNLLAMNGGYDQVMRSLAALRKHGLFETGELARFAALSKEARAATNSYPSRCDGNRRSE